MEDNIREHLESRFYADLNKDEQGYKWELVDSGIHPSVDIWTKFGDGSSVVHTNRINVPLELFRKMSRDLMRGSGETGGRHGYLVRNINTHEVLKYVDDRGVCESMEHTFAVGGKDLKQLLIHAIKNEHEPNTRRFDLDKGEFSFKLEDGEPVVFLKVRDTGRNHW